MKKDNPWACETIGDTDPILIRSHLHAHFTPTIESRSDKSSPKKVAAKLFILQGARSHFLPYLAERSPVNRLREYDLMTCTGLGAHSDKPGSQELADRQQFQRAHVLLARFDCPCKLSRVWILFRSAQVRETDERRNRTGTSGRAGRMRAPKRAN
jgi:hypothetical protein